MQSIAIMYRHLILCAQSTKYLFTTIKKRLYPLKNSPWLCLVFSSIHPFVLFLEADSLHMDLHGVENLELPAIQTLTGFFVHHASILTPDTSGTLSPSLIRRTGRSATLVLCTAKLCTETSRRFGRLLYHVTFLSTRVLYQWAVTLSLAIDCF